MTVISAPITLTVSSAVSVQLMPSNLKQQTNLQILETATDLNPKLLVNEGETLHRVVSVSLYPGIHIANDDKKVKKTQKFLKEY